MSNLSRPTLAELSRYRWSMAILAAMAAGASRHAELLRRVGLSRDSLSRNLEQLVKAGWVLRNPGHGHPLRPEYLLTEKGKLLAATAGQVIAAQEKLALSVRDISRWTLPIADVLAGGASRFSEIEQRLPNASPRAISLTLKAMTAQRLVNREVEDGFPPSTLYALSASGAQLAAALEAA